MSVTRKLLWCVLGAGLSGVMPVRGADMAAIDKNEEMQLFRPVREFGQAEWRHGDSVNHVTMVPGGKQVLSASDDGTVRLWDLRTGKEQRRYWKQSDETLWHVLTLANGKQLATAGSSHEVRIYNLQTGELLHSFKHSSTVFRLAVSPNGKQLAAVDGANECILWDLTKGHKIRQFSGHSGSVYTVAFADRGKRLLTGSGDESVRIWNVDEGASVNVLRPGFGDTYTLVPQPKQDAVLACFDETAVQLLTSGGETIWTSTIPDGARTAAWSPDGKRALVAGEDGKIYLLNAEDGGVLRTDTLPGGPHHGLSFTTDGTEYLCALDHLVARFRVADGKRLYPKAGRLPFLQMGAVDQLAVDAEHDVSFSIGTDDPGICVRDVNGRVKDVWLPEQKLRSISLAPNGKSLAAGGSDGQIWIMDPLRGTIEKQLLLPEQPIVRSLAFSADSRKIAAGCSDDRVTIWTLADISSPVTLIGHASDVNAVAFSPDGLLLVSAGNDKTVRVWELENRKLLQSMSRTSESFEHCAFLPSDGRSVIASQKGEISVWPAAPVNRQPLTADAFEWEVRRLGADQFQERRAATKRLVQAGRPILERINEITSDDPEVRLRLKQVRRQILDLNSYKRARRLAKLKSGETSFAVAPNGSCLAVINGSQASSRVEMYTAGADGNWTRRQAISFANGASALTFAADGRLFVGCSNGTVKVLEPVAGQARQ